MAHHSTAGVGVGAGVGQGPVDAAALRNSLMNYDYLRPHGTGGGTGAGVGTDVRTTFSQVDANGEDPNAIRPSHSQNQSKSKNSEGKWVIGQL